MPVEIAAHAIIRYFERIEGLRMSEVRKIMRKAGEPESAVRGDTGVVKWMRDNGYHVAAVEALFDQPMVENAIKIGALRVKVDQNCWAVINGDCVVSCATDAMVRSQSKITEKSGSNGRKPYYPRRPNSRPGYRK
jgi:hypothetical protein